MNLDVRANVSLRAIDPAFDGRDDRLGLTDEPE